MRHVALVFVLIETILLIAYNKQGGKFWCAPVSFSKHVPVSLVVLSRLVEVCELSSTIAETINLGAERSGAVVVLISTFKASRWSSAPSKAWSG